MGGTSTEPQPPRAGYRVSVESARFVACFALAAFVLLFVHSALTVYHYQVEEIEWLPWRQMFDVDEENNLPT